uniref:Aminotransferase class-I n=1 Tax=Paulinella chromatophora TaxID=39717 RepID=B1X4B7_PAUCH|nr:Aminotransferase class-I [Paulinella chromatophora]ACB42786.1 Aminotransferase class-I [Paulinella chromatophora]
MDLGKIPARLEVESLEAYSAPLEGRRGLLRLDFNENTIGPSPRVLEKIKSIPSDYYAIYPEYEGLQKAIINNLGVEKLLSTHQVGIFNGVDASLHAILHAFGSPRQRMIVTSPTFGYYIPCARMQGMRVEAISHNLPDLSFPFQEVQARLTDTKVLLICNPNNPTGTRLSSQQILILAKSAPNTLVVVDELYETFTGDGMLSSLRIQFSGNPKHEQTSDLLKFIPNLVILRSLAKTSGIAGLRLGFAIGQAEIINRISRVIGPYDINSFAVTAGLAALSDQPYVDAYVSEVLQARVWLISQLKEKDVCYHIKGGNYLLIWPRNPEMEVNQRLREEGILVRSMYGKKQINGSLRVSIGTCKQMRYFWWNYIQIE